MRIFAWDEENRLKRSMDDVTTVNYLYNSYGNRTVKHTEHSESLYFDAMWSITSDYPDFRQSKHIYVGESRIATKLNIEGDGSVGYEEVNTYYYHTDHLGSAQLITDYQGGIYEHMEYTPYGELWIEEKSESFDKIPFRFTGKELDEETNLYYYGARYLSPKTGNWFSSDPNGINLINPNRKDFYLIESLNWYVYCNNNPLKYIDPTGLKVVVLITHEVVDADGGRITPYVEGEPTDRSSYEVVPTYKMIVGEMTDDGEITRIETFEVTKDALYNDRQFQMIAPDDVQLYGKIEEESYGKVVEIFKEGFLGRDENAYLTASDNGEKYAGIQIHVGGMYKHPDREEPGYATSTGCFTLNGADAGGAGRDRFIGTVEGMQESLQSSGNSDVIEEYIWSK